MNERSVRGRRGGGLGLAFVSLGLLAAGPSGGPIDAPSSNEPRVEVGTSLAGPGLWRSKGVGEAFHRTKRDAKLHSRDMLLALPGFQPELEPASKNVRL